jgi:hypothetical protein
MDSVALASNRVGSTDDHRRATDLLRDALSVHTGETVTIREVIDDLGDRAFGLLLLLFALPNCIPAPPGRWFDPRPAASSSWRAPAARPRISPRNSNRAATRSAPGLRLLAGPV